MLPVLFLLLLGASLSISTSPFPPICCDSNSQLGPWRLNWLNDTCFTPTYTELPGCAGPCCNPDLFRVDFPIRQNCIGSIEDIYAGSTLHTHWSFDLYTLYITHMSHDIPYCFIIRPTSPNTTCHANTILDVCDTSNSDGKCMYRTVDHLSDCCPTFPYEKPLELAPMAATSPPPSPASPSIFSEFPYCKCLKNQVSQYTPHYQGLNLNSEHCFSVLVDPQCSDSTSPCCSFDLNKIEWAIPSSCVGSVAYARVNGAIRATSQSFEGGDKAVFKITNLNILQSNIKGLDVCIKLREGKCDTLEKFCGTSTPAQCRVALFEKQKPNGNYCCVVSA